MPHYQSVFPGETVVAAWVPPAGSPETGHLVLTDRRLAGVIVVEPDIDELGSTTEISGGKAAVELALLAGLRIVTEQALEPSQVPRPELDPEIVEKLKALGLPPPPPPPKSGRRFHRVVLQLLDRDGNPGYERVIGYYEEGGFTAHRHQLAAREHPQATQNLPIHTQEQVRLTAEDLASWIRKHCPGLTG